MFDELYETHADPATAVATTKAAEVALEDIDLQKIALAHFDASNVALQTARQKLTGVVHDLSTATKLAEAKSLRERLINAPLAEARKVNKGLKAKLTAVSKAVGARLESIEAGFADAEKLITPQIEARDAELAAEKAEREAKEAGRVAVHRENIAKLASYVGKYQGKSSSEIAAAIVGIERIDIIPEQWEEFAAGAASQKAETLQALRDLFARTEAAEDEAAAREAQRIENERVAAELAAREAELAAKQAEIDRKLAVIAAAEKAEADRAAEVEDALVSSIKDNAHRIEADTVAYIEKAIGAFESMAPVWENDPRERVRHAIAEGRSYLAGRLHAARIAAEVHQAAEDEANRLAQEAAAEALMVNGMTEAETSASMSVSGLSATIPAVDLDAVTAKPWALAAAEPAETYTGRMAVSPGVLHPAPGPVTFAEPPVPATDEEPTLTLGAINARFGAGFTMTAAFVTDVLGIAPAGTKKAAILFRPSQLTAICDALVEHASMVCEGIAA